MIEEANFCRVCIATGISWVADCFCGSLEPRVLRHARLEVLRGRLARSGMRCGSAFLSGTLWMVSQAKHVLHFYTIKSQAVSKSSGTALCRPQARLAHVGPGPAAICPEQQHLLYAIEYIIYSIRYMICYIYYILLYMMYYVTHIIFLILYIILYICYYIILYYMSYTWL